ncbi:MAG TPA: scyllo-inosose 3-dehydrogenase [Candidatus Brocadiia bacterium]|nr:scyllo-inosose 3-dehydrogenase [Candidatus Brocadiia bacterium]
MKKKMKAVRLYADWSPKPTFKLGAKDIEGRQTYLGSQVYRNPKLVIEDVPVPEPGDDEVMIEVKACGICGSDVHMAQADKEGYIFYPGLTGFPATLGHEFSGVVVKAGKNARDKSTNRPFKGGEYVCAEEMLWCGRCQPCCDGFPNHCERLDELGFNVDGAYAKYIVVRASVVWNLAPLQARYSGENLFIAGALVEPTSVAYNAVIVRGGGVRPGDNAVICGGGPVGLASCALMKKNGAKVILSEPESSRAELGLKMGADEIVNPAKENFTERVLQLTAGMGAKLYLEAAGLPTRVYPAIEQTIWEGKGLNSTVVVVARADAKMPVTAEVLQVRRAQIVGTQGHSGDGIFPHVISAMSTGMDMTPLVTKKIALKEVPAMLTTLQTDRRECKVMVTDLG